MDLQALGRTVLAAMQVGWPPQLRLSPRNASSGKCEADVGLTPGSSCDIRAKLLQAVHRLRRREARWKDLDSQLTKRCKAPNVALAAARTDANIPQRSSTTNPRAAEYRPMSLPHRSVRLLAAIVVLALCRIGGAQVFGERLLEPYRFASLVAELQAAGVDVPPLVLVEAYRRAIERFGMEQAEFRAALHKAIGSEVRRYFGLAEVDRALAVIRRARGAAEAVEDALFNDLALALPEGSRPGIERVRDWRRTQRAVPRSFQGPAMFQFNEIGDLIRRSGVSGEELGKALLALEPSEGARRNTLTRLLRDDEEGRRAAAKVVDEAGVAGQENKPGEGISTRMYAARAVGGPVIADAIETQLKAFRAVREALPRQQRRMIFDQMSTGLIGDQQGGYGMGLPGNARQPSEVARRLLASKELTAEERKAAREIVARWLDADDEAVLSGLEASVASLRKADDPLNTIQKGIRDLQERRGEIARVHLASLAKAGGAWLVDPSIAPPALDEATMVDDDRTAIGINRPRPAPPPATSAAASRSDLLPAPLDTKSIDELSAAVTSNDDDRARATTILRDHAAMFETTVRPTIETSQALVRMFAPLASTNASDEEIESAATTLRELRKQAFAASDALDDALATALIEALGERSIPAVRRAMASRRLDESVGRLWVTIHNVGFDTARAGGSPCNLAATIDAKRVPPNVRGPVETALSDEWSKAFPIARLIRDAVIDDAYGQAMSRTERAAKAIEDVQEGDVSASSPNQERRADALVALLERWQPLEDALAARAIDAATAAGDEAGAMRDAIDRSKFGRVYNEVTQLEAAIGAIQGADDFPERAALLMELERCRTGLAALSKRRADVLRPRVKLSTIPAKDRMYVLNDRAWDEHGIMLVQWQLFDASTWLVERMTPKEVLGASPDLRGLRRFSGW